MLESYSNEKKGYYKMVETESQFGRNFIGSNSYKLLDHI